MNAEKAAVALIRPIERDVFDVVRRMVEAERAYGCGFYGQEDWIAAYNELAAMAGMKTGFNSDEH